MERGSPTQSGRMQGARLLAYFWRGRPSGCLPKVNRRKGGTVKPSNGNAADNHQSNIQNLIVPAWERGSYRCGK
jgi:hypothetical protein